MKKFTVLLVLIAMVMTFTACGNKEEGATKKEATYTVDSKEVDPNIYPDNYPLLTIEKFEEAFNKFKAANLNAEIKNYKDVVDFFGVDGAYYKDADGKFGEEIFKYYGWYGEDNVSMIVTFKANGKNLEFYAYNSNGVF